MTLEEAKAYLRVGDTAQDAMIEAATASAESLCEAYIGGPLVRRELTETIAGGPRWQRLSSAPVHAIVAVAAVDGAGDAEPLAVGSYAVDIDARGDGWVRAPGVVRLQISYEAGLAPDAAQVPAALRHGVVRLAAHLFTARDLDEAPPAAVTALWRLWRRLTLHHEARP